MSLDSKTLALLTAKDHYLEAEWLDSEAFTYLSASANGFLLMKQSGEEKSVLAEGLSSPLAYAGTLYSKGPRTFYLSTGGSVREVGKSDEIAAPGPSTDLIADGDKLYLVSEIEGENRLYERVGDHWNLLYRSRKYLRHLSRHPSQKTFLALTWPEGELPWFAAELILIGEDGIHETLYPPGLNSPCAEAEFSPSGECLVASFLTDEYHQLWLYKLKTKNWVQLTFDEKEHSTPLRRSSRRTFTFLKEGLLAFTTSDKGFWRIDTLDFSGHSHKIATPFTLIQNPRAHPKTGRILAFGASLDYPYGPVQIRLEEGGPSSHSYEGPMPVPKSLRAERISWAGINGETIHGILYRDSSRTQPSPLILPIHGGPTDAVQATWPSKALAFVRQGYAVFYVNFRGSYGYGISYLQKLEGGLGQIEINDLVTGVKSLAGSGRIDPTRVGLWGGGTASFTVLRALTTHPEIFAAGIAVFPILNLSEHLSKASEPERTELLWALGGDDEERLKQLSPASATDTFSRPLGLFAGGKDKLLPPSELESFADLLKARKIPCWLTIYENEGRSFRSHETYSDYYSKVSGFFDRFLKFRSDV